MDTLSVIKIAISVLLNERRVGTRYGDKHPLSLSLNGLEPKGHLPLFHLIPFYILIIWLNKNRKIATPSTNFTSCCRIRNDTF